MSDGIGIVHLLRENLVHGKTFVRKNNSIVFLNTIFICIVLYLHHGEYTNAYFGYYPFSVFIQRLSVGGFIFLAGFKLAQSKLDEPILKFVVNRLVRIYPLYIIAILVSSFVAYPYLHHGEIPTLSNAILHILCLQAALPNKSMYDTLWFVSVLFFCYGFFAATRKVLNNILQFSTVLMASAVIVLVLHEVSKSTGFILFLDDMNIYLILFGAGMILSTRLEKIEKLKNFGLLSLSAVAAFSLILLYSLTRIDTWYKSIIEITLVVISTVPLYIVAFINIPILDISLAGNRTGTKVVEFISYSSLCIFLFHRSIWTLMSTLWPGRTSSQYLFIVLLGTPLIILSGYLIQRTYDRVRNSFTVNLS